MTIFNTPFCKIFTTTLAIAGSCITASSRLSAEDTATEQPGIVRVSDAVHPIPEPNKLPQTASHSHCLGCNSEQTPHYYHGHHHNGRQHIYHYRPYSWGTPQNPRIYRTPVGYQHYWAQQSNGQKFQAQHAPMIYQPTDTTQLGYYYHRVPQWQPNPGMLPPKPSPTQWHSYRRHGIPHHWYHH